MIFSVVIPSYNRAHQICDALDSIARQRRAPDRVIIVDDGSKDNTESVVSEWLDRVRPVWELRYIYQENAGPSAARNRGIMEAGVDDFIAFLDSDDVWPDTHLMNIEAFLVQHSQAIACSGQSLEMFEDESGIVVNQKLISLPLPIELQGPAAILCSPPHTSATVIRRSALIDAGLFDRRVKYGEDKLLFMMVSCLGEWGRPQTDSVQYRNKIKSIVSGQLSNRPHKTSRIRYARMLEKGIGRMKKISPDSRFLVGSDEAIWKGWHRAGREWDKLGKPALAAAYYRKAAGYGLHSKTLLRLVSACIKSLGK